MSRRGCPVCESTNRGFVCPNCLHSKALGDGKAPQCQLRNSLCQLQAKREALLARLNELLAEKVRSRANPTAAPPRRVPAPAPCSSLA